MISAVAVEHPDLAYDFALANRAAVEPLVDAFARAAYIPSLAGGSADPAMVGKLEAVGAAHPASARPAAQSAAAVRDRGKVRQQRQPDITRWLETKAG